MRISDWSSDVCSSDLIDAQGLAGVAQHAFGPVGDDHGRKGGPVAPVFVVDVLNDLFAALMFEIHVDVGRLAALFADEKLEKTVAAGWIHFRDAKAVADGRVGGRDSTLAKDELTTREL